MELENELSRITAPTLIVTTQESGLHSVEAVERFARQIPRSRVIVLPGDSYHIAAVEPDTLRAPCAGVHARGGRHAGCVRSRAAE